MNDNKKSGELFIVDNSVSGWTGLRYLQEWCEIAKSMDIATGFFEIGSLLALDGKWQQLDKIRILMGDEITQRSKKILLESIRENTENILDESIEEDKEKNPFLTGVDAIVDALKTGQIECRVYNKSKFHAKTYIIHAKQEVVGAQALVGSSNFTFPGLTQNIELNIRIQGASEVNQLQEWYEEHWDDGVDVTDNIFKVISRHTEEFTPFDIYSKALQEFFKGHEMTAGEWDQSHSLMFPQLDHYQKEAYWQLQEIARYHGGAFLCDGVGLGKTFVGLMLIERLILHDNRRVVLFAPKGAKEAVWEPHLRRLLPNIGGIGGGADFSNLAVFSHTDFSRGKDYPERFKRIGQLADVVIVDEAHHFRNRGKRGDVETNEKRSRYWQLFDMLDSETRPKKVFFLTATPINNELNDFRHVVELFSRGDDGYFARSLGVTNLTSWFSTVEKELKKKLGGDMVSLADHTSVTQEDLSRDTVFRELVVQRSRSYARESQLRETGSAASFPNRKPPVVAEYSIRKSFGKLLDLFSDSFARSNPLFSLAIYFPLAYYTGDEKDVDPRVKEQQKQVVGLIRTLFLKRFESSIRAFEVSCDRLLKKLLAFLDVHCETDAENAQLEQWINRNREILFYSNNQQMELWGESRDNEEELDDDIIPPELLENVIELERDEYDVATIIEETFKDLDQLAQFVAETKKFKAKDDDKLQKLKRLLNTKALKGKKVIIFSEYADTTRYIYNELRSSGIEAIAEVDSANTSNRIDVIQRFSPYYNESNSADLEERRKSEIQVLVSTDVLSEGLNLQDACRMINYDIHWNPVRLMQRIGRVDRRLSPEIEEQIVNDHPDVASDRGQISYWNFLPPKDLKHLLSLYKRVTTKTLLISETLGIEGRQLLHPEDHYNALREFNKAYNGTRSTSEDMHLEYQQLLKDNPQLADRLTSLPNAIFSGRKQLAKGISGVFLCYGLPAYDKEQEAYTYEAGPTRWYLFNIETKETLEEPGEILGSIRSKPNTPRKLQYEQPTLVEIRDSVRKHIKNTYEDQIDLPADALRPSLKCWMELN